MKTPGNGKNVFQVVLERKELELIEKLHNRDGIAIEKSADEMDETQGALERELAIRNADRDSSLLSQVRAALRRVREGSIGTCIECDEAINPKRLAAVPWASRCVQCQEAAERTWQETAESPREMFANAR